jgi:hypothetical protein
MAERRGRVAGQDGAGAAEAGGVGGRHTLWGRVRSR